MRGGGVGGMGCRVGRHGRRGRLSDQPARLHDSEFWGKIQIKSRGSKIVVNR